MTHCNWYILCSNSKVKYDALKKNEIFNDNELNCLNKVVLNIPGGVEYENIDTEQPFGINNTFTCVKRRIDGLKGICDPMLSVDLEGGGGLINHPHIMAIENGIYINEYGF